MDLRDIANHKNWANEYSHLKNCPIELGYMLNTFHNIHLFKRKGKSCSRNTQQRRKKMRWIKNSVRDTGGDFLDDYFVV